MRATIGAAPVPVPPPAPAAMKTMSEPLSSALMRSYSSIADWRPRSGFEPAPRPRVTCGPMCRVMSAVDCCSDCRSVLMATNSTPSTCASTMRLTALTPAPPTPTTRSTGCPAGLAVPHGVGSSATREYGSWPASRRGAGRLHDVVRDVRAERVAQALLRRRHVRLALRRRLGRRGAQRRVRIAGLARVRWRRLWRAALLAGGGRRRGDAVVGVRGRRGWSSGLLGGLLGLAEQVRQRPLPHARALTACHWREPPSRDRDRTGRPSRPDRT